MPHQFKSCSPGHFYAVGIGPGSSDMITVRAKNLVESSDIILAPRSRASQSSMALDTIAPFVTTQRVEECIYPMNRNEVSTRHFWGRRADQICRWCVDGHSVVQVTIGDPLIYSTSCYLLESLTGKMPKECVHVVPGISAFQAASAFFQESLTIQEDRMMLMPATDIRRVSEAMEHCETLVLYKVSKQIETLCTLLEEKGYAEDARLVCYAENAERQYTTRTIRDAVGGSYGYMATVIVHLNRARWGDVNVSGSGVTQ